MSSTLHPNHRLAQTLVWLLVFGAAFGVLMPSAAIAAPSPQVLPADSATCHPVDVVVLVDQSDSMRQTNDQNGRRFEAAATVVEYLGLQALWQCRDQVIQHRVSVIGFGDNPAQGVGSGENNPYAEDVEPYLTNLIVPQTNDFEQWDDELEQNVVGPIAEAANGQLGATDHYAALLAAHDQLTAWREQPLGDQPRRQAVVVITDGEPCLFARSCGEVPVYNIGPDMAALEELTDPNDAMFPWSGADNPDSVHLSLIAMSRRSGSMQDSFFNGWRLITQGHGGDVYPANALNTNLNVITADIMDPVIGSGMEPVSCNTDIWINPYTDNLVIIYAAGLVDDNSTDQRAIVRINAGEQEFEVIGGQATVGDIAVTEYLRQKRNEYYIFQPPVPGRYNVSYSGADPNTCSTLMEIRVSSKSVIAEVTAPTAGSSFPAMTPPSAIAAQPFRLEVFESIGDAGERVPLVEFEDYPINVTAAVSGPEGHAETYAFHKVADGVYESTELIQSPIVGDYNWTLRATVQTLNPDQPEIVVLEDSGRFAATEVLPFGFVITQPADGAGVPLNTVSGAAQQPVSIPVTVELVDSAGEPANIDTFLKDDSRLFTASLMQGDTVIETAPLARTPGSATAFSGELTNSQAGGVVAPGDYTIEVTADWSPERYNPLTYAPANDRAAIGISQYEVVPLDLRISSPGETTLHVDDWLGAFRGQLRPVEFYIEFVNAVSGEQLSLNDVLRDPQGSYQAAVVPPSGNPIITPLTVVSNENFQRLEAEGVATDVAEAGEYAIKLDTAVIPLNDRFAWASEEASTTFTRQDTTFSRPLTWRVILGTAALLVAALLGWIIYMLTGGPTGSIAVFDLKSRKEITLRGLRTSPRVNTIKHRELTDRGVKYIKLRRGAKDEDGHKTVVASAWGAQGEEYLTDEPLTDGIRAAFLPDAEIVYRSRTS